LGDFLGKYIGWKENANVFNSTQIKEHISKYKKIQPVDSPEIDETF